MTDYLGPLTLGSSGTYALMSWELSSSDDGLSAAVEVMVSAANADALTLAVEALAAQLRAGNSYIHAIPGTTSPVAYRIAGASDLSVNETEGILAFWAQATFKLSLAAYPAGALSTMYSAEAVDSPASLSLEALLGTHPPQLDICVDDDSGLDMHSIWCALAPKAVTDSMWLVLASVLTWTTMSSGTGATWWGNSNRYTTSASWQTASLDTSKYPPGKYRLLARVAQSAGTGYVMDAQNQNPVAVTRTTPHLIHVGDVDLPVSRTAYGVASPLVLSARSDGSNTLSVGAYVPLPLDLGLFAWHPGIATTECDQLDVGPSGVFVDGVAAFEHFAPVEILRPATLAAQTPTHVETPEPTGSDWPTDWARTDDTDVTADSGRFKVETTTGEKYATYAATPTSTALLLPEALYELTCEQEVSARSAGTADVAVRWLDLDGALIREDTLSSLSAVASTSLALYAEAPTHAVYAQVKLGASAGANLTAYWSDVVFRRCPLRLIVVAEDAAGELVSYVHPVKVTLQYAPVYEVAR